MKNTGRKLNRDATVEQYLAALPGGPEEVAAKLGVSLRRVERSLGHLRRLGRVERRGGVYAAKN